MTHPQSGYTVTDCRHRTLIRHDALTRDLPRVDATLHLSDSTLAWLAECPLARALVDSVWDTLAELERAGHHPLLFGASCGP